MTKRLENYKYMKNLTDWVSEEHIFNKEFVGSLETNIRP